MSKPSITLGTFIPPSSARYFGAPNDEELNDIWAKVGESFGYLKPDGWRIQIHNSENGLSFFSRTGKDYSTTFQTISNYVKATLGDKPFIIDTELLGFDQQDNHLSPTRIQSAASHRIVVIDALYLDKEDITDLATIERNERLKSFLRPYFSAEFYKADYQQILSVDDLSRLYHEFVIKQKEGYDGIILKRKSTPYFVDAIKIKSEITLDPIMVAIDWKKDRSIQAILVAVRDNQTNLLVPIGKVTGQGVDWDEACQTCLTRVSSDAPPNMVSSTIVDQYLIPDTVVQITARSISKGVPNSYLIRVDAPRNLFLRKDKDVFTSTDLDMVCEMAGIPRPDLPLSLFGGSNI